ncbi:UBX domain-containing protein 6 [Bombus pascuorum]|uniref:UBX domain-containing protein 6 n=1 Tax=Bombus pascuorum TaxID=65598 RepID=UPI002129C79C|nr:UBX domain-containing protein 6 [Bombus pascuorum]XP_060814030.1 UBX domain-containing protein 6 [Bombus pascuorum]XP_060814031.1 UBX domain-containing protein 6 [Bombus pascuorum]XP_060814033.1 UBX domain-containing protein 6 [Bombus pascuorum]XP_060814034.1 UBX domain-containing protein 6 [Bombus pascuorum]XP_060814035.1 UBX domain-containing protein 6 [Bombus pascuorum]XP_060814036.1 UBX domain-containing protein 6 [Bombus pascuorum]
MTEKIKSLFGKAKLDVKFMNAGKGHKLTESTSNDGSTSVVEPRKRVEPTNEAKVAGQAALARLEAKESNIKRFNTSYAAIKAQVKRELEQKKKAQQNAEKDYVQSEEKAENAVKDNSLLAVTNVYYRCPYLSDEILSQDEWKVKIKEFLYEQLKEDKGVISCLIIQNCNSKKNRIDACVETLGKYLENIINNPEEEKYQKIRMQNRIFQDKVAAIEGALEFLNAAGFHQKKLLNNDKEDDFLIRNADNCDIEDITMLLEALKTAQPIPLELDRNLQVLLPMQANKRTELPSSFFNLTAEDIEKEQQLRTEAIERDQMFRTKAMRERDEKKRLRKYKFSLIRIKFPDNLILQGTFSVQESFQNVVDFVSENLINNERPFSLKKLPQTIFSEDSFDKTLLELELFPAVILMFFWKSKSEETSHNESVGYLKEELLSIIQPA